MRKSLISILFRFTGSFCKPQDSISFKNENSTVKNIYTHKKNTLFFEKLDLLRNFGHLPTLMATVTVLSYNYPEKKWIKPVGYIQMGLTARAMMNTQVHWAGDYPLAIATRYLSGKITTWRHKVKNKQFPGDNTIK